MTSRNNIALTVGTQNRLRGLALSFVIIPFHCEREIVCIGLARIMGRQEDTWG